MKQKAQPKLTRLSINTVQKLCVILEIFLISPSYISLCYFLSRLLDLTSTGVGRGKKFPEMSLVGSWLKIF